MGHSKQKHPAALGRVHHGLLCLAVGALSLTGATTAVSALRDDDVVHGERADRLARQRGLRTEFESRNGRCRLSHFEHGRPRYLSEDNTRSADTISTDDVRSLLGLTGFGVRVGLWDSGDWMSWHRELARGDLTAFPDNDGDGFVGTTNHATHVAGTMVARGRDASATGMAPRATLWGQDWNSDIAEMGSRAGQGLRMSNHSYGLICGWYLDSSNVWQWAGDPNVSIVEDWQFGYYGWRAQQFDQLAVSNRQYLIVQSAGNDRGEGPSGGQYPQDGGAFGWDTIPDSATCKNTLVVGAVNDIIGGYQSRSDVVMSSFSSFGPTDDGRIKPDLVANGVSLYSTSDQGTSSYTRMSGTSMASPSVTGSIALLMEHWRKSNRFDPFSSTMKALVLHTADDAGNIGPDYQFGWGLMNTESAAAKITEDSTSPYAILEAVILPGETWTIPLQTTGTSGRLRATLCWTDPAGTSPAPGLDPTDPILVNDLDLRIVAQSGATMNPYRLDPTRPGNAATTGDNSRDNVEQINALIRSGVVLNLVVRHKGRLGSPFQIFSLVLDGATRTIANDRWVADYNADGSVDGMDLVAYAADFRLRRNRTDVDANGVVTGADWIAFAKAYKRETR